MAKQVRQFEALSAIARGHSCFDEIVSGLGDWHRADPVSQRYGMRQVNMTIPLAFLRRRAPAPRLGDDRLRDARAEWSRTLRSARTKFAIITAMARNGIFSSQIPDFQAAERPFAPSKSSCQERNFWMQRPEAKNRL